MRALGVQILSERKHSPRLLQALTIQLDPGLPQSGKKFWKMKTFPGQGKVRELHFQSGKFKKK